MAYKSLRDFIKQLEKEGELVRIAYPVSPEFEITEITDRLSKTRGNGKALLFERNGTQFPLLINAFGSEKRMAISLGCENLEEISQRIEKLFKDLSEPKTSFLDKLKFLPRLSQMASWMPKTVSGRGACQQVRMKTPDLSLLPVLKCWPADGGAFITLPCVVTRDPETGARNVGMYRMQVMDKNTTGMHWHKHKTGARHYAGYKQLNRKMPVSVVLGGDPVYTYVATAPLPDNIDEYMFAGFLRNRRVELVKCLTNDLEVPADADIIIEGYIDTMADYTWEGPFGDHTGFYSLADWYPKFQITCITHRKDAVYPATIVGIPPQEDAFIGKATERIFLVPMKKTIVPELNDIDLPASGVAHNITIASIEKTYEGQVQKVMNALWGAGQMMFNKIMIITDHYTPIHNYSDLARIVSETVDPAKDISFSQGPMDVLDHSSAEFAYGSKMGIDATLKPSRETPKGTIYDTDEIHRKIFRVPTVVKLNTAFLDQGISVLIVGIAKEKANYFHDLITVLLSVEELYQVKFILLTDSELDIDLPGVVSWFVSGNIDPKRDCFITRPTHQGEVSHLFVNGTRKSEKTDGFTRDWPNPVVSSQNTIQRIDAIWSKLDLGDFIPSPSLNYLSLQKGEGAVSL